MEFRNAPTGWTVKSTKKVYDSDEITVYEDHMDLNGKDKIYIRSKRRDFSVVVPFVSNNELMMIKHYRRLVDSYQFEVPLGYVDDETPRNTAIEVLREQTGYASRKLEDLGVFTLDYTMSTQKGNIFVAYDLIKEKKLNSNNMEKELCHIPILKVRKMLLEGTISDSSSIIALYRAISYHEKLRSDQPA